MFSRTLLIACVILFFKMQATLGAVVARSALSSTTSSSTASTQTTYHHGLMWKGYEHEVVGSGSSGVPQPSPKHSMLQRAPSPAEDTAWAGAENQNTPPRPRREGDTNKRPRSPMPTSGRGYTWKGREHEEDT